MAECNDNTILSGPENVNYLASNYFKFSVTRIPTFTYFVQSANIPSMTTRYLTQPNSFGTYPKTPAGNYTFDPIDVTFMVSADMSNWVELYQWMKGVGNLKDDRYQLPYNKYDDTGVFSDASLMIMNSSYRVIGSIVFKYVFPISLGAIPFTSQNASTDPISCSVQFAYTYYEYIPTGATGPAPDLGVTG
jgi:hypothetical protein